jgi:hypothetical protein
MTRTENEFEPRLGRPGRDVRPSKLRALRTTVRKASKPATSRGPKPKQPGVRAHFAKGSASRPRPVANGKRRVVVKVRYAANAGGKGAPLRAHVAYLAREARGPEQQPVLEADNPSEVDRSVDYLSRADVAGEAKFQFYDQAEFGVDPRAITAGWADDPRHFRMIISAEDGEALGDLKPFIRETMAGLEAKLGTKLEWLAVDHHDTDNPHTHVLIRGRRPDGQELFIPSRLISSGIREHAQEIVTRALGPRVDLDLARERMAEIDLRAPTGLDRELAAAGRQGLIWPDRPELARRLEHLERWDLADRSQGAWRVADGLITRLKALADADELERAVAPLRSGRDLQPLLEADSSSVMMGELVHVSVADDFGDRFLAIIQTGQGELRYARFERADDLAVLDEIQTGAIVSFEPAVPTLRPSDETVARVASKTGGFYSPALHGEREADVGAGIMAANVRRLEAMRRMGLVERRPSGEFEVGSDHLSTALRFEERLARRAPFTAKVQSYWSLNEQVDALARSHLDRVLAGEAAAPEGDSAFSRRFEHALQQRRLFLIEQGWMGEQEAGPSRQALQRMATLELSTKAKELSGELGLHVLTHIPNRVAGVYARRIDLAQGRMALIIGDRQAMLVPWRPALERFAGRGVEGVLRGQTLSWKLERGLGIGLPPM